MIILQKNDLSEIGQSMLKSICHVVRIFTSAATPILGNASDQVSFSLPFFLEQSRQYVDDEETSSFIIDSKRSL
jgi:hypothetical protein